MGADTCSLALGGSGPLQDAIAAAAESAPNVSLVGQVDNVAAFLSAADAVVVPSLYEAFGLVATEARLAGRPVLVADVDGLPEQVGHGGLVAPCNTSAEIADAISRFTKLPLNDMAMKAQESARNHRMSVIEGWKKLLTSA